MKYSFFSGLSGKIALIFLLAFLIVVVPVNSVIYSKLKTTLVKADDQQLKGEAEKLLSQLNLDPLIIPLPPNGYSIKIQVEDGPNVHTLFSSPKFPPVDDNLLLLESFDLDTLKILNQRKPIPYSNGEIIFTISRSNQQLHQQLAEFRLYLFYITGTVILLILVLVFTASGIMLRPIKKIIEASEKIATATGIEKLSIPSTNDETKQLATALNAMLSRIEVSSTTQQNFFDSATHELKTPLSIMKAELSHAYNSSKELEAKKMLAGVLDEVARLEHTISDFLLVSQLKSLNLTLRKEKFSLAETVYTAVKKLQNLANDRKISISIIQSEEVDFHVEADSDKIQTVVLNLLENAIRYSPQASVVLIRITLTDHGKPLLEIENEVTQPVQNIEELGKDRYMNSGSARGLGLGLWICKQIIELHDAEFSISQNGVRFKVIVGFI
ncbi:MAG TPA: ATP-binding protein [Cyclobacteriaceae bacterium]|nr:ATP-binding protein [Cyclobacteriaceae bacterium]